MIYIKIELKSCLLNIIILLLLYIQFFSYTGVSYTLVSGSSHAFQQIPRSLSLFFLLKILVIIALIILGFTILKRKSLNKLLMISIFALVASSIFWSINTLLNIGLKRYVYETSIPYIYLITLSFIIGVDEKLFLKIKRNSKYIVIFSFAYSIISLFFFIQNHPQGILGNSTSLMFFIQGFWFLYLYAYKNQNRIFTNLLIAVAITIAILLNTRSFLIQSLILFVFYNYYLIDKKKRMKFLKTLILVVIISTISFWVVSQIAPQLLEYFMAKGINDTRSFQYKDFFRNIDFSTLLFGKGYEFQYYSSKMGGMYSYIDNGCLFLLFRYGISILLPYITLLIVPIRLSRKKISFEDRFLIIIIIVWFSAISGLSVYNLITLDLQNMVPLIVAGRLYMISKNNYFHKNLDNAIRD